MSPCTSVSLLKKDMIEHGLCSRIYKVGGVQRRGDVKDSKGQGQSNYKESKLCDDVSDDVMISFVHPAGPPSRNQIHQIHQ